jgi:hypothetical protein
VLFVLRGHRWCEAPGGPWLGPALAGELVDLGWHRREFPLRHSFAYTVVTPDDATSLGCVYPYPREGAPIGAAADVFLGLRYGAAADPVGRWDRQVGPPTTGTGPDRSSRRR